jgi:hypothetical protein
VEEAIFYSEKRQGKKAREKNAEKQVRNLDKFCKKCIDQSYKMEIQSGVLVESKQNPCEWCEQNESALLCLKCDTHQLCNDCSDLLHSKQKLKSHLETIVKIDGDFDLEHYICLLHDKEK